MIVVDASALVELVLGTANGRLVMEHLADATQGLHVPHLADVEVAQALRRYLRAGVIDRPAATVALGDYRALDLQRHPHEPLLERVWELRANFSAYDAVYVALAEALGAKLLTCDGHLARAPGMTRLATLVAAGGVRR